MACDTCLHGDKTTLQLVNSGFTAAYTSIGGFTISREIIDATVLGTEVCREKCPGDKIDRGEMALEWCYDPDSQPPYDGDPEPFILTYPPKTGQTNGATVQGEGWFREFTLPTATPDERLIASAVLVQSCGLALTFTDGS